MGTYNQWASSSAPPRRFTWVCGPEQVLRAEVVSGICHRVQPDHRIPLFAGDDSEQDIWDACWQLPAPGETRLVIVREADQLKRWDELEDLVQASSELLDVTLVFVSAESDYYRKTKDGKEVLRGPAAIQASPQGQIVKCSINEADRLAWVHRLLPGISSPLALELLELTGQDLSATAAVCDKFIATGLPVTAALVKALTEEGSSEDFADNLIYGRKRQALLELPGIGELGSILGLLASRLDTLAVLHGAMLSELPLKEIVTKLRVPQMLAVRYRGAALEFSPARVLHRRKLLADLDSHYRAGATDGVAEVLVAGW